MTEVDFFDLFKPLKKQAEFLRMQEDCRYMLYGGARGGGKSRILRWGSLYRLLMWAKAGFKNVRTGLFSEDYPTLKDRQITKIATEFPDWLGRMREHRDEGLGFFLHERYGGGGILLRNLDDPSKYQSAEFAGVAVEELTKNPISVFDILRGSLRWPGIPRTFFWGATNPGGIGHLWVRSLWIDRAFTGDYQRLAPLQDRFGFVQSLPADNPYLDAEYWLELNSLEPNLRAAWVDGSWDVFQGQAFGEWARDVHITEATPEKGEDRWKYRWWATGDWGYDAPGVLYLNATSSEQRTVVRLEWKFRQMPPEEAGIAFARNLFRYPIPEYVCLDEPPQSDGGPTIIERFQAGMKKVLRDDCPPVMPMPRSRGSRFAKKQLMHEMLAYERDEDGTVQPWNTPKLQFHSSCKYAILTIPALPLAGANSKSVDPYLEDVDTNADDHAYDAIAGGLLGRVPSGHGVKRRRKDPDQHPGFVDGERADAVPEDELREPERWTRSVA